MKKIIIFILSIFIFLALVDGIIHTPFSKAKATTYLQKLTREAGFDIQAEKTIGVFPNLELENVQIETNSLIFRAKNLKADLSILRLFKKEIYFDQLTAEDVTWEQKESSQNNIAQPKSSSKRGSFSIKLGHFLLTHVQLTSEHFANLEGSISLKSKSKGTLQLQTKGHVHFLSETPYLEDIAFSSKMIRLGDQTWDVEKLKLDSEHLAIKGLGTLDPSGKPTHLSLEVKSKLMQLHGVEGRVLAHVNLVQQQDHLTGKTVFRIPSLTYGQLQINDLQGTIRSQYFNQELTGSVDFSYTYLNQPGNVASKMQWHQNAPLTFSEINLQSELLKAEGSIALQPDRSPTVDLVFETPQVHSFYPQIYGKASGQLWLENAQLYFDTQISNAYVGTLFAKELSLHGTLLNPSQATATIDISDGRYHGLQIHSATVEISKETKNSLFQATIDGKWKHPLSLTLSGSWDYTDQRLTGSLDTIEGTFFDHSVHLNSPTAFAYSPNEYLLKNFELTLEDASIFIHLDNQQSDFDTQLVIQNLPIDFLSLNPLDVAVDGSCDLELFIKGKEDQLRGRIRFEGKNIEMILVDRQTPFKAHALLSGQFDHERLDFESQLTVSQLEVLKADISLPIEVQLSPFKVALNPHQYMRGNLALHGPIQDILDFLDLGSHRIEGNCDGSFKLSHTLANPYLTGSLMFTDGYYQNYFTGTELQNINAQFLADGDVLHLTHLTAKDCQGEESVQAKGAMYLTMQEDFPFQITASFNQFNSATFDLIQTIANGDLTISGNLKSALAKGNISVMESRITIPNRIPRTYPNLNVTYIHLEKPLEFSETTEKNRYPLHLDLSMNADDKIYITGRGLNSEWRGQFHVTGTQTAPITEGELELIKGEFRFANREFTLEEGSLIFHGKVNEMPSLNLSASIDVKDVSITIYLQGPINNPQITLQSSPPLPMGTIMAYLLFGQDLADINSFQALQLANSIVNIAGESPSILEQTRKSLGVDQIQLVTVRKEVIEDDSERQETVGLEVGKYITEDVLVLINQGAENSSPNIKIEVQAKAGLSFLLESDQAQDQKQGKFTLRWSHTY